MQEPTEGEDKPLKYPVMFQEADCLLITKTDLTPYLDIDIQKIADNVHQMNPNVTIIPLSAKTGAGLKDWFNWLSHVVLKNRALQKSNSLLASEFITS